MLDLAGQGDRLRADRIIPGFRFSNGSMERLLRATINTWHGLRAAARSEEAFRQELVALVLAVPLAFLLAEETWKRLALVGVVVFVLVVELLNTAIEKLADRLCAATFADTVFFQNSGAEAIECAIKMARKYQSANGRPERFRIITFEGAFHGRTLAALAATGNKKYLDGFGPPMPGFDQVPFADLDAVKKAIGPETAAIIIEPVMGEGGVRVVPNAFLRALRKLCDDNGLLLVFDEIQTGVGRTGDLFAYEHTGVEPDIMALAKALGGGFPIGACLATEEASKGMTAGTHGSTFGGNELAMAVGNAVLDVVTADGFIERVRKNALLLKQRLAELKDRYASVLAEVRGEGLLIGLRMIPPASEMVDELRAEKMITVAAGDNVVRLLPPLIIGEKEIAEAIGCIDRACARLAQTHARRAKVAS
jgi:acetylornithine/N-succinyldiaminopimelate aminotransferase